MIISIIFPVFNGLNYTKACLNSLYQEHKIEHKNVTFHVVVVDDGSTDGSSLWIASNYPQVILLKGNGNLWWSGGVNKGVQYAIEKLKTDYILWWNNDIIANTDYFDNLIVVANTINTGTIVGSKIFLAQDKQIVWSMGGFFDPYSGKKGLICSGKPDREEYHKPMEVDWLPGMGTLIHKSVFEHVGFVDEKTFPQYHGDSDFTYRAKENGCKIMVYPSLKIYNDTRKSGLKHQESFKLLIRSMFTIRSNYNIAKDIKFYRRFSKSNKAYFEVANKYFRYTGGFFKWKVLKLFGRKR